MAPRSPVPAKPRRRPSALAFVHAVVLVGVLALVPPAPAGGDSVPPVEPPVPGEVIRPFDPPERPYGPGHRGVDLAADPGDPVRAALPGRVAFAGRVADVGWVTIDHGGGLDTTHGDVVPSVARGDRVWTGRVIGHLAPAAGHVDWGARRDGHYLDPMLLLERWTPHLVALSDARLGDRRLVPSRPAGGR